MDEPEDILRRELAKAKAKKPSTAAKPKKAPPRIVPWVPMPTHWLPTALRELAEEGAGALGCDPSYLALPGLAVLASAIGNTRSVQLKRTWKELPILWCVVVGDSGTLKTPAFKMAMRPIWDAQREWKKTHKEALATYQEALEDYEARKKEEARKKREEGKAYKATPLGDPPADPGRSPRRASAADITVERLAEMLEDNPRGILVARDELAGWFNSFMKYKAAGAGSDVPNWLEMYQGGTLQVDRKTGDRRTIYVEHASISVIGGIQPGTLGRALREEFFECGLVARLLLAAPPRMRKAWTEAEVLESTSSRWRQVVYELLALTPYRDGEHQPRPYEVQLSPEAKELWVSWYDEWAGRQDTAEGEIAACFSKIEAVAARVALVHHCAEASYFDRDDKSPLRADSMQAGIELARWFAAEAERNYAAVKAGEAERAIVQLVDWIRRQGGEVAVRDLHRANQRKYTTAESAREALEELAGLSLGKFEEVKGPVGGPSERFRLVVTGDRCDKMPPEAFPYGANGQH